MPIYFLSLSLKKYSRNFEPNCAFLHLKLPAKRYKMFAVLVEILIRECFKKGKCPDCRGTKGRCWDCAAYENARTDECLVLCAGCKKPQEVIGYFSCCNGKRVRIPDGKRVWTYWPCGKIEPRSAKMFTIHCVKCRKFHAYKYPWHKFSCCSICGEYPPQAAIGSYIDWHPQKREFEIVRKKCIHSIDFVYRNSDEAPLDGAIYYYRE